MSTTFTNKLQVPSEFTALPNRFTRPFFGLLYGYDATPSEAPSLSISSYSNTALSGLGYQWILSFPPVPGAVSYDYRSTPGITGTLPTAPLLSFSGLPQGSNTPIQYQVRAVNAAGSGEWSNAVEAIYLDAPTLTVGTPSGATLPLTWTNLRVGGDISYELQYATDAGFTTGTGSATIVADTTSYNFTMTTPGTTYYFKLRGKWTSSGPPSTDAYGIYSATVSHLYPALGFTISIIEQFEATILARSSDPAGEIAYGEDTESFYVFNGVSWFKYPEQQ